MGDIKTVGSAQPVLMTLDQVSREAQLGRGLVRRLCRDGRLDALRLGRRTIRVRRESFESLVRGDAER